MENSKTDDQYGSFESCLVSTYAPARYPSLHPSYMHHASRWYTRQTRTRFSFPLGPPIMALVLIVIAQTPYMLCNANASP